MKICFATNNQHKIEEVAEALAGKVKILSLKDIGCVEELPETQPTIPGNATQKSRYVWDHFKVPCFADDSGLEVIALNNDPGVFSARYAGPQRNSQDNINLLLGNLIGIENRKARFRTVISLQLPEGEWLFEGTIEGTITKEIRGTEGFGYDPVFLPDGYDRTFAEMKLSEKNKISHRGRALEKLVNFLDKEYQKP